MISKFVRSPNFKPGRSKAISAIVLHYTESTTLDSPVSWFEDPASGVSAHYVVGPDGTVVQMVLDGDVAWHAGRSAMHPELLATDPQHAEPNVNGFSIGIEMVGTADTDYPEAEMQAVLGLLVVLVTRYKVRPERVVGHSAIAPGRKIDPEGHKIAANGFKGHFDWPRVRAAVAAAYAQATQTV